MSVIEWVLVITLTSFLAPVKVEVAFSTEQECEAARARTHTNVSSPRFECQPRKKST